MLRRACVFVAMALSSCPCLEGLCGRDGDRRHDRGHLRRLVRRRDRSLHDAMASAGHDGVVVVPAGSYALTTVEAGGPGDGAIEITDHLETRGEDGVDRCLGGRGRDDLIGCEP